MSRNNSLRESDKTHIYALADPRDGSVRYIGKADNVRQRFNLHVSALKHKSKKINWIKSLKSVGLVPNVFVVDEVLKCEWPFWEMHYISLFKSFGFSLTNGTDGGDSGPMLKGRKKSAETKEKMKVVASNRHRSIYEKMMETKRIKRLSLPRRQPITKEEIRKKLVLSHANQKNENLRVPVIQMSLSGEEIKEWESISEAARFLVGSNSCIVACLKGKNKTSYGYRWKYKL